MHTNMNAYKTVSLPLQLSGRQGDNVISVRGTEGCSFDLAKHRARAEKEMERAVNLFGCWIMKKANNVRPCPVLLHCSLEFILKTEFFICSFKEDKLLVTSSVDMCIYLPSSAPLTNKLHLIKSGMLRLQLQAHSCFLTSMHPLAVAAPPLINAQSSSHS